MTLQELAEIGKELKLTTLQECMEYAKQNAAHLFTVGQIATELRSLNNHYAYYQSLKVYEVKEPVLWIQTRRSSTKMPVYRHSAPTYSVQEIHLPEDKILQEYDDSLMRFLSFN